MALPSDIPDSNDLMLQVTEFISLLITMSIIHVLNLQPCASLDHLPWQNINGNS